MTFATTSVVKLAATIVLKSISSKSAEDPPTNKYFTEVEMLEDVMRYRSSFCLLDNVPLHPKSKQRSNQEEL